MDVSSRVIEEASRLFLMHGVRSVTMDDVAAQLGMSKRTLYEYYHDKDRLLAVCLEKQIDEQRAAFAQYFASSPNILEALLRGYEFLTERVRRTNPSYIKEIRKYHPQVYRTVLLQYHDEVYRELVRIIRVGQRKGLFLTNLNPKLVATLFQHRNEVLSSPEHHSSLLNDFSLVDILEALIVHTIRGIATVEGIRIIDEYMNLRR